MVVTVVHFTSEPMVSGLNEFHVYVKRDISSILHVSIYWQPGLIWPMMSKDCETPLNHPFILHHIISHPIDIDIKLPLGVNKN